MFTLPLFKTKKDEKIERLEKKIEVLEKRLEQEMHRRIDSMTEVLHLRGRMDACRVLLASLMHIKGPRIEIPVCVYKKFQSKLFSDSNKLEVTVITKGTQEFVVVALDEGE